MFDRKVFFAELLKHLSPEQQEMSVGDTTALSLTQAKETIEQSNRRNTTYRDSKSRNKKRSLLDQNAANRQQQQIQSLLTR